MLALENATSRPCVSAAWARITIHELKTFIRFGATSLVVISRRSILQIYQYQAVVHGLPNAFIDSEPGGSQMKLNLVSIKSAAPAALVFALVFSSQSVAFAQ